MDTNEVQFSAVTDVGKRRDHNEDNYLVDKKLGLFVVCDGMGGHAAGEVASALAVRTIHEEIKRATDLLSDFLADRSGVERVTKRDILNMMEFAVTRASSKVYAEAQKDSDKRGMGTTLVAMLVLGRTAFITYVGDSRAYMLRDGILEQLTEDHNVYNELVRRKKMSQEQAEQVAQKNALTRAIGVYEHVEADSVTIDTVLGDRFLLCSDGLSSYFEDTRTELGRLLGDPDTGKAANDLVGYANDAGGSDNITAIVLAIGGAKERDEGRALRLQRQRDTLEKMALFRTLNDHEILRVMQVMETLQYSAGAPIVNQGEIGDQLFIVLDGKVKVRRGDTELATLFAGDHFGELALIRNEPRSATVVADSDSEMMAIRRSDFFEILRKEHQLSVKLLWQFLRVLGDRLAVTTQELGQAKVELAAEDLTGEIASMEIFDDDDDEENRKTLIPPRVTT